MGKKDKSKNENSQSIRPDPLSTINYAKTADPPQKKEAPEASLNELEEAIKKANQKQERAKK